MSGAMLRETGHEFPHYSICQASQKPGPVLRRGRNGHDFAFNLTQTPSNRTLRSISLFRTFLVPSLGSGKGPGLTTRKPGFESHPPSFEPLLLSRP